MNYKNDLFLLGNSENCFNKTIAKYDMKIHIKKADLTSR